ncbi:MAG: hypothetical protein HGA78_01850 [Nitrospirales bacterium]|nr:hypothetical protein [Nitrospirales bacterium]
MAKKRQSSLFYESALKGAETMRGTDLTIVPGGDKKLSKNQQAFNRLSRRIEQLQLKIGRETGKLEELLKVYVAEIHPNKLLVAQSRLKIAKALGDSTERNRFGKKQLADLRTVILTLCDEAFSKIDPDEETEQFYDAWADRSYQEEVQLQTEMIKQKFLEETRNLFGISIEPEDLDDTPEGFARLAQRMQKELDEGGKEQADDFPRRKKTKKQLEMEELQKREEELSQRSMRSIFLSLAKALHPDTITDPEEKARKEELMKKVTEAYTNKDLSMLLKLEMEWVRSEERSLDILPDDQLKLYISSLKKQVEALEEELEAIYINPRFAPVCDFSFYPKPYTMREIHEMADEYAIVSENLEEALEFLSRPASKKEILGFVKEYMAILTAEAAFARDFGGFF